MPIPLGLIDFAALARYAAPLSIYPAAPTAHALLVGNGSSLLNVLSPGSVRNVAISDGTDWTSRALQAADIPDLSAVYQPLDADLTAIAALNGTGFARQAGAGSWSIVAETGSDSVVRATSPTIVTPTIASFTNAGHDHSNAAGGGKLAQANTHQSPDTDAATTSLHHTIGTSATQAAAGNHTHTQKSTIGGASSAIAAGLTRYLAAFGSTQQTVEANAAIVIPYDCTVKNLYCRSNGSQPAGGSLVVTVMAGAPGSASATSIVATLAAGTVGGVIFSDTSHTAAVTAGQTVSLRFVNNDGSNPSAAVITWSLELDVTI